MERIWNTIVYTVLGTLIGTAVTFIGAFVLSQEGIPHERAVNHCFCHTMFFGGGTIPDIFAAEAASHAEYCMVIVLPGAFNVWLAIVGRTFIQSSIPEELFELHALMEVIISSILPEWCCPWPKPILAVLALNFALTHWNSYYSALLYLNESVKFPLQLVLRKYPFE